MEGRKYYIFETAQEELGAYDRDFYKALESFALIFSLELHASSVGSCIGS